MATMIVTAETPTAAIEGDTTGGTTPGPFSIGSWEERLMEAVGTRKGFYDNCMRRSVQSVILYEAHRCVATRLPSLRPFQRKLAFMDQAHALLDTLPNHFINAIQKEEIMWRTGTSKKPLNPDLAWKRMRAMDRELAKLSERVKPFWDKLNEDAPPPPPGVTLAATMEAKAREQRQRHMEACDMMVQSMYEGITNGEQNAEDGNADKDKNDENDGAKNTSADDNANTETTNTENNANANPTEAPEAAKVDETQTQSEEKEDDSDNAIRPRPLYWEHAHCNIMLVFRMYYLGDQLDFSFPPPKPPRDIVVPVEKPVATKDGPNAGASDSNNVATTKKADDGNNNGDEGLTFYLAPADAGGGASQLADPHVVIGAAAAGNNNGGISSNGINLVEARRRILAEVKEHLNLLKEFEGIVPEDELIKRKRELFMALPPAPPAACAQLSSMGMAAMPAALRAAATGLGLGTLSTTNGGAAAQSNKKPKLMHDLMIE